MGLKNHDSPNKITEDAIREAFTNADSISFAARNFNSLEYRPVTFDGLDCWMLLKHILPAIDITPEMLRPVFDCQRRKIDGELPENIEDYDTLGSFPLLKGPFQELAKILGKTIEVYKEDGGTGSMNHLATVHPSGEIVEAVKSS